MRASARALLFLSASVVPLACTGSTQPPVTTPSTVATTPANSTPPPQADVTPVAEPPSTVAVMRWKNPGASFNVVQRWFGIPVPLDKVLDEAFDGQGASAVVAVDAPVDAIVVLNDKASSRDQVPFMAFSVGLRSVSEAQKFFARHGEVTEAHPGIYRMSVDKDLTCFLAPALGVASARMVCGARDIDVETLYPYMTRGLSTASMGTSDFHLEARMAPVQKQFGSMVPGMLQMGASLLSHEIGTGDRSLDRAVTDAVTGLSDETIALFNDLDGMTMDLTMQGDQSSVTGQTTLRFKGKKSWTAQRVLEKGDKAGPAPELFWRMPNRSDSAIFNRGSDPKATEGIRTVGAELLKALLAKENFPAADREAVVNLFKQMFMGEYASSVSASGHIEPVAVKTDAKGPKPSEADELVQTLSTALGWQLMGMEGNSKNIETFLQDFAKTYSRPAVKAWLAKKLHIEAKNMPTIRTVRQPIAGLGTAQITEIVVPSAALMLPKGQHGAEAKGAKGKAAPVARAGKPLVYSIIVLPDGNRTWVAMGADRPTLDKQLAIVKAPKTEADTIKSRMGLESLKADKVVGGGYMTIASFTTQASNTLTRVLTQARTSEARPVADFEKALEALARMPNHGETPMLMTTQVKEGATPEFTVNFRINKGSIDDMGSLALYLMTKGAPPQPVPQP